MKASFPQPPSERSDVGALSKSPRLKSVHFNRQEVSEAEQRQNELQELHEKVEALAMILGKVMHFLKFLWLFHVVCDRPKQTGKSCWALLIS